MEKKKKCPEGSILNELTNRCNKIKPSKSKTKKTQESKTKESKTKESKTKESKTQEEKIFNPKTGRYVLITGKIGKEILKQRENDIKETPQKTKSKVSVKSVNKTPVKDHIVWDFVKSKLDSFDKIKLNLLRMSKIKLSPYDSRATSSFIRFNELGIVNDKSSDYVDYTEYFDEKEGETIHGHYNNIKFIMQKVLKKDYVIPHDYPEKEKSLIKRDDVICLLLEDKDKYIRIPDLKEAIKNETCSCNIFVKNGVEEVKDIMDVAKEFLEYVFKKSPSEFDVRIHKFVYPASYIDHKDIKSYQDFPRPVPTIAVNKRGISLDVVYLSLLRDDILYVFHVNKGPDNTMKGYQPIGVSIVQRYGSKRYWYLIRVRMNCQGWGLADTEDESELATFMKEIRNIILSKGFLSKFRCLSPYPKFVLGCNISKHRVKIRSCY